MHKDLFKFVKFLNLNICNVIYVLLWIKYWAMWFERLLVFILFKFKKRPTFPEVGWYILGQRGSKGSKLSNMFSLLLMLYLFSLLSLTTPSADSVLEPEWTGRWMWEWQQIELCSPGTASRGHYFYSSCIIQGNEKQNLEEKHRVCPGRQSFGMVYLWSGLCLELEAWSAHTLKTAVYITCRANALRLTSSIHKRMSV